MQDFISRQAAIDVAREELESGTYFDIPSKIEALPSAQPSFSRDQENDPIEPQGDAVSREAVLDMLHQECSSIVENFLNEKINAMPSVTPKEQPGIIRCKDCKYRMPYDWMFSEVWQSQNMDDYPDNEIGCQYCDMRMTADFCSRAERREE